MCPVTHSSLSACSIVLIPSMLYSPSASSSCSQSLLVTCCCSDLLLQVPQLGWLNADLPISIPNLLILGCQFGRNSNLMLSLRNSHLERWMSSKWKLSQLHINSHQTKKKSIPITCTVPWELKILQGTERSKENMRPDIPMQTMYYENWQKYLHPMIVNQW
jgi:hypothetical protein